MQPILNDNKGVSIVEILIAMTIIIIALASILSLATFSLKAASLTKETTKANAISQEAMEAVRSIRDSDWAKLTPGSHGLTSAAGFWDFTGTENVINGFTRTILIENVSRDPTTDNIEITYNPANNDPNTKKITATVSWKSKEVKIITYLANWK